MIYEEEFVHEVIREWEDDLKSFALDKLKIRSEIEVLDDKITIIDSQLKIKDRELNRKIEQEILLVEKCKEFVSRQKFTLES